MEEAHCSRVSEGVGVRESRGKSYRFLIDFDRIHLDSFFTSYRRKDLMLYHLSFFLDQVIM